MIAIVEVAGCESGVLMEIGRNSLSVRRRRSTTPKSVTSASHVGLHIFIRTVIPLRSRLRKLLFLTRSVQKVTRSFTKVIHNACGKTLFDYTHSPRVMCTPTLCFSLTRAKIVSMALHSLPPPKIHKFSTPLPHTRSSRTERQFRENEF